MSARAGSSSLSLPLVIFSPGLHGLPEIYSHYCEVQIRSLCVFCLVFVSFPKLYSSFFLQSLASYGYIVASVRHTDGSVTSLGPKGSHPLLFSFVMC